MRIGHASFAGKTHTVKVSTTLAIATAAVQSADPKQAQNAASSISGTKLVPTIKNVTRVVK